MGNNYKHYLIAVLMLILAFSYLDRMVFGLALQDIKVDLGLTDTQLGLLTGLVFALFFAVMGLPIARWTDRGNRVVVVTLTTALWSIAIALCGMVGTFAQLVALRIGAACGEAGCNPPAHSLIPEYFSRADRPRAVARYLLGVPLGVMIGYLAGGWLIEFYGWRATFVVIGLPGMLLAIVALLTLKEPRKEPAQSLTADRASGDPQIPPSLKEVIVTLARNATFRNILMYLLLTYFYGWAQAQWLPAFFVRTHNLGIGELGTWLALVNGGAGLLGTWLGGEWASRYAANNEALQLRVISVLAVIHALVSGSAFLMSNPYWSLAVFGVGALSGFVTNGPVFAALQSLVSPRYRATALTLVGLFPAFIGMGFGPWTVGMLSDAFASRAGDDSLRLALVVVLPVYIWAGVHLWRGSRTVARDIALAQSSTGFAEMSGSTNVLNEEKRLPKTYGNVLS